MGFPALHTGLFIFDPFGIGAKAPNTSIFDASRLKALNMNSPRQSLGRSMQPETSLEGLNHKGLGCSRGEFRVGSFEFGVTFHPNTITHEHPNTIFCAFKKKK
jgi:hypothetical protein